MQLLVATRSEHKIREIRRILADVPHLVVRSPDEAGVAYDPVEEELEPFETFEENARSKAEYFRAKSGLVTVADDSGIEVDALGGAPGVRSKRFAPDTGLTGLERDLANNRHMVELLQGREASERGARYVCVAALVRGGGQVEYFRGEAGGVIMPEPVGTGGFGYDPHFFDPELGRTFAEISAEEKNARSHRGRAFAALAQALGEQGG
ncbi:MAG: non-canonical purine NTP pyrophosphatase [Planctomycetota bacterium]|jgi:XTP/dITP diphosphohydrolase